MFQFLNRWFEHFHIGFFACDLRMCNELRLATSDGNGIGRGANIKGNRRINKAVKTVPSYWIWRHVSVHLITARHPLSHESYVNIIFSISNYAYLTKRINGSGHKTLKIKLKKNSNRIDESCRLQQKILPEYYKQISN